MKTYVLLFVTAVITCTGCTGQNKKLLQEIVLELKNPGKDTCIRHIVNNLPQKIYREIEIVENNLTDTVVIGFAAIPPRVKERFVFIQVSEDVTQGAYFDRNHPVNENDAQSYSEVFCIYNYQGRKAGGNIKLKIRVLKE